MGRARRALGCGPIDESTPVDGAASATTRRKSSRRSSMVMSPKQMRRIASNALDHRGGAMFAQIPDVFEGIRLVRVEGSPVPAQDPTLFGYYLLLAKMSLHYRIRFLNCVRTAVSSQTAGRGGLTKVSKSRTWRNCPFSNRPPERSSLRIRTRPSPSYLSFWLGSSWDDQT